MKKIFSLLMVVAIILTMSITSFAADPVLTVKIVETDSAITAKVYVYDVTDYTGLTLNLMTTAVTAKNEVIGSTLDPELWSITPSHSNGRIKYTVSAKDTNATKITATELEAFTFELTKVKDGELATSDFSHGSAMGKYSNVACLTGASYGKNPSSKTSGAFTVEYVDERTPVGGGDEGGDDFVEGDWSEVTVNNSEWNADNFTYVDATTEEKTTGAYAGKKVVAFGKNASNKAYASGEYGVKIGANEYPGLATVEVGQTFAIVLIDTNNDAKVKGTYTYSIWTLENDEKVTKASGLNAQ